MRCNAFPQIRKDLPHWATCDTAGENWALDTPWSLPWSISAGQKACCSETPYWMLAQPAFPRTIPAAYLRHPRHSQTPIRKFSTSRSFESPIREVFAEHGHQGVLQTSLKSADCPLPWRRHVIHLRLGFPVPKRCCTKKCRLPWALFLLKALLNPNKERGLRRNLVDTKNAGENLRGGGGDREECCAHEEWLSIVYRGSILGGWGLLPQWCTRHTASAAPKWSGLGQSV